MKIVIGLIIGIAIGFVGGFATYWNMIHKALHG